MPKTISPRVERFNFAMLCAFFVVLFLTGGGSDPQVRSLLVVRLAAILVLAIAAVQIGRAELRRMAPILLGLSACVAIVALQLIPLPPELWTSLPGRAQFVQDLAAAGIEPGWHPLSLTPDGTLNTLLALLTPLAVAASLCLVDRSRLPPLFWLLLGCIAASALLGVIQVSNGLFYTYEVTNRGSAVGLFANRNHQGLLLAIAFPLLAAWVRLAPHRGAYRIRGGIAVMCAFFLIPLLLTTGSRAGLLAGLMAGVLALLIVFAGGSGNRRTLLSKRRWIVLLIAALAVAAIGLTIYLQRAEAIERMLSDQGTELRIENLGLFFDIAATYFPVGSGFGSFAWIYQISEPYDLIHSAYFNHAHNDIIQLVIESGLPAIVLMVVFIFIYMKNSVRIWKHLFTKNEQVWTRIVLGAAGSAGVLLLVFGSLVDYPLRTPIFAGMVIVFLCAMHEASRPTGAARKHGLASPATSANPRVKGAPRAF